MNLNLCIAGVAMAVVSGQLFGVETASRTNAICVSDKLSQAASFQVAGQYDKAIVCCDKIIVRGGSDVRAALKQKGDCLYLLRRYADACQCWENALKHKLMRTSDDDIVLKLAEIYAFSLGLTNKAEKLYRRLLALNPPSPLLPEVRYQYAGMIYSSKNYTNAATLFQELIRKHPASPQAIQARAYLETCHRVIETEQEAAVARQKEAILTVKSAAAMPPKSRSATAFEKGENFFNNKLYREALTAYQQVKNDAYCREHGAACFRMGQCYAELGNAEVAIRYWQETVETSHNDTNTPWIIQSLKAIGDTYFDCLANPESALKYYRKLVADYPDYPEMPAVHKQIGLVYLYQGDLTSAKAVFEHLRADVKPIPHAPPTDVERLLAFCDGRQASMLPDLKQIARGNRANVARRKADVYFTAREYGKALQAYKTTETLAYGTEEGAYALMQAGRCHLQLFDANNAIRCYRPFFEQYAKSQWADDALMRAAVIYVGQPGNKKAGVKTLETIVARYPHGDQVDRALVYLATLAAWDRDWKRAKGFYAALLQQYLESGYRAYVETVALPQLDQRIAASAKAARANSRKE